MSVSSILDSNSEGTSPANAAKRLGVSRQTVVNWIESGKLPAVRTPGGYWRLANADVEALAVEINERLDVKAG